MPSEVQPLYILPYLVQLCFCFTRIVHQQIEADKDDGESKDGGTRILEVVPNHVVCVESPHHVHQEHIGRKHLEE